MRKVFDLLGLINMYISRCEYKDAIRNCDQLKEQLQRAQDLDDRFVELEDKGGGR